jgi:MoaA/NifB/PqqE/SkfB family radical SAM enzyme
MMHPVTEALAAGELPGRVWFYSNYHCNLTCNYCFTESSPSVAKRALEPDQIIRLAHQAAELGYTEFGITGGEPFLLPYIVDVLKELSDIGPTIVISNATVFGPRRFARATELAGRDVQIQISLDAAEPVLNDEMRGPENFAKVVDVVPRLVAEGVRVRIATTVEPDRLDEIQHDELCALHRSWGIDDDDHIVRPVIERGRAAENGMGQALEFHQFPAELTFSVDGAFWGAFGPSFTNGKLDTDLLLTRTIEPVATPAAVLHRVAGGRPQGADAAIGIR